eukprot:gene12729-15975_t
MNFQGDYIYVIREREFINTRDNIFKVGRSGGIIKRMAQYPKGSSVRCIVKVANAVEAKREVISLMKRCKQLTHCTDIGDEYFQGNIDTIIGIVTHVSIFLHGDDTDGEEETSDEDGEGYIGEEEDIGIEDTEEEEDTTDEEEEEEEEEDDEEEDVYNVVIKASKKRKHACTPVAVPNTRRMLMS